MSLGEKCLFSAESEPRRKSKPLLQFGNCNHGVVVPRFDSLVAYLCAL